MLNPALKNSSFPQIKFIGYTYLILAILSVFLFLVQISQGGLAILLVIFGIPVSVLALIFFFVADRLVNQKAVSRLTLTMAALITPLAWFFTAGVLPNQFSKILLGLLLAVSCLTIIVIFLTSRAYFYKQSNISDTKEHSKLLFIVVLIVTFIPAIIFISHFLKGQQQQLNRAVNNIPQTNTNRLTGAQPKSLNDRRELSAKDWYEKFITELDKGVNCEQFYNERFSNEPNTTITYVSNLNNYSIDFPYKAAWGDNEHKVLPYETSTIDTKTLILFGRPYPSEGCSYARMTLEELPPSTIEETIRMIESNNNELRMAQEEIDGLVTYQSLSRFKYPVLQMETTNALFGSVYSYKVFLPMTTLKFSDPFTLNEIIIARLTDSIKIF